MLSESRHLKHIQSPLSMSSSTLLSILLKILLQIVLVDAVRPAGHEDGHAVPEIGKVQPLQIATRPGGALVQERATTKSQVQTPNGNGEIDEDGLDEDEFGLEDGLGSVPNASEKELEKPTVVEDMDDGMNQSQSGQVSSSEDEHSEDNHSAVVEKSENESSRASDESESSIRNLHPHSLHRLTDFRFKLAPATADALDREVGKLKDERKNAVEAYKDVDQKMGGYEQSIQYLSDGFNSLKKQAHGIHDSVLNEYGAYGEKEAKRMCQFKNAERIMEGKPPLPCPS